MKIRLGGNWNPINKITVRLNGRENNEHIIGHFSDTSVVIDNKVDTYDILKSGVNITVDSDNLAEVIAELNEDTDSKYTTANLIKEIYSRHSTLLSDDEVFESAEIILKECVKRIDDSIIKSALKHSLLVLKEIKY